MENTATNMDLLYEKAKKYAETNIELLKLNAIDKTADVSSSIVSRMAIVMVVAMFTLFLNVGISLYIGKQLNENYLGFLIVSAFYLLLAIILYFFNKPLIQTPIANLIIRKLLKKKVINRNTTQSDENVQK